MIDPATCIFLVTMATAKAPAKVQRCATPAEVAAMIDAQRVWDRLEAAAKKAKETAK